MKSQTGEKRTGFLKLKQRRDSNVVRVQDAVKIRLESEEKAKKSVRQRKRTKTGQDTFGRFGSLG